MQISLWQPPRDLMSLREAMNRLFEESFWMPNGATADSLAVPMDVYTDGDGYVIEAALPGAKPGDVDVQMIGNTVTISGELKLEAPEGRQYLVRQRSGGRFQASVSLPDAGDASQIKATLEHGVLRLEVPKSEAAKPKRIPLKAGQ